jgi:DNA repair exonuclease SbcCD nuclease subunit
MKIAYISDIHIEFVKNNSEDRYDTPEKIAELFVQNLNEQYEAYDVIVVAGDISHCIADIKKFFAKVDSLIDKPLLWVNGNHDIWDWGSSFEPGDHHYKVSNWPVERLVGELDKFSETLKHTTMLIPNKLKVIDRVAFIGDCGYSGYIKFFPVIYRGAIKSQEEERMLSDKWREFYLSQRNTASPLVVITHNPMHEWGLSQPDDGIYYISGHIHPDNNYRMTPIIVTDHIRMDSPNGYRQEDFTFHMLEI